MNRAPTWHEGERALQARAGIGERMAEIGPRVIRDHMPDQHRSFFAQLPFLVAGSLDAERPALGQRAGGAARASRIRPTRRHLRIDALPLPGDPLRAALAPGAPIGLLGIEPHTRRRNRMNGVVEALDARGFSVAVGQSFGNCPQVHPGARAAVRRRCAGRARRAAHRPARCEGAAHGARRPTPSSSPRRILGRRCGAPAHGVDVSHRGGRPGFVQLSGEGTLTVPDFMGNAFFNTLGNIAVHPRAGLLFIDFETGDLLQILRAGRDRLGRAGGRCLRAAPSACCACRWWPCSMRRPRCRCVGGG